MRLARAVLEGELVRAAEAVLEADDELLLSRVVELLCFAVADSVTGAAERR